MESMNDIWAFFLQFVDLFVHLDQHLNALMNSFGPWLYLIVFLVVFCETGLVVTPFLPGDSLLFALGALAALENSPLQLPILLVSLFIAAVLGDAVNFSIGRWVGPKVFQKEDSFWLNKKHLEKTQSFYDKHGGKTIVLARFMPIVRTFAPFVAGIGNMNYSRFAFYNITGAIAWVGGFLVLGYFFGNLPAVKSNFSLVILGIIILSVLPIVYEFIQARLQRKNA